MKPEYDFSQAKRGAVIPQTGKTHITIYIDYDVLETFQERGDSAGTGYQTIMNEALREYLDKAKWRR
ncbi:BrnA antitoxin family protein [Microcoleus sp. herbarium14]|uniref:BrnA antitoxin family protein n=1 Tax=Microcoleus sp. herbarium14 TaxID=3055439 RepID=UPI002FD6F9C0